MSSIILFVCSPQDLSSFAMPFLEGDAEHANKDSVCKVTQHKHKQDRAKFGFENNFCCEKKH